MGETHQVGQEPVGKVVLGVGVAQIQRDARELLRFFRPQACLFIALGCLKGERRLLRDGCEQGSGFGVRHSLGFDKDASEYAFFRPQGEEQERIGVVGEERAPAGIPLCFDAERACGFRKACLNLFDEFFAQRMMLRVEGVQASWASTRPKPEADARRFKKHSQVLDEHVRHVFDGLLLCKLAGGVLQTFCAHAGVAFRFVELRVFDGLRCGAGNAHDEIDFIFGKFALFQTIQPDGAESLPVGDERYDEQRDGSAIAHKMVCAARAGVVLGVFDGKWALMFKHIARGFVLFQWNDRPQPRWTPQLAVFGDHTQLLFVAVEQGGGGLGHVQHLRQLGADCFQQDGDAVQGIAFVHDVLEQA